MPPVFGPRSPSHTRLWSWALGSITTLSPSHSAKIEASSPSRYSSTTTVEPDSPNAPEKQSRTASAASWMVIATVTPLPAASPSALITIGAPWSCT